MDVSPCPLPGKCTEGSESSFIPYLPSCSASRLALSESFILEEKRILRPQALQAGLT